MKMNQRLAMLLIVAGLNTFAVAAEQTVTIKEPTVNVRGKPSFLGEVITQLKKGEKVVVLEEIAVAKPKKDEPAAWLKIQMPANTPVWVNHGFIDPTSKAVRAPKLNLRAGPGENFSVIGRLLQGDVVKEIRIVDAWMEIDTPPGTYAFIASELVSKEPASAAPVPETIPATLLVAASVIPKPADVAVPATPPPAPVTEKSVAAEPPPVVIVETPAVVPATPKPEVPQPAPIIPVITPAPVVATPGVKPATEPPAESKPAPKRIAQRQGRVKSTLSIQAPTYFELVGQESGRLINYIHLNDEALSKLETTIKGFRDYIGRIVIVSGEEAVDPRWPNTPVIEVESLKLAL
ncbi:MAG: hypothetical protein EXS31_01535 [Pedosphaera sp.]|nr:hypothetical protein [Pedosphaera sp.]